MIRTISYALAMLALTASSGLAAVVVNIWEDGSDVRMRAAGSVDLSESTELRGAGGSQSASLGLTSLTVGADASRSDLFIFSATLLMPISTTARLSAVGSGDVFGLVYNPAGTTNEGQLNLSFASGYAGEAFSGEARFADTRLTDFGFLDSSFQLTLSNTDTIDIQIGQAPAPVPLPAGGALLLSALGLGWTGRRLARAKAA